MHFFKKLFPQTLLEYLLYAKYVIGIETGKNFCVCAQGIYTLLGKNIINFDHDDDNRKIFLFCFYYNIKL